MIILEGADCVGKTTIARKLCKELGYTYQHLSRPVGLPNGREHRNAQDYIDLIKREVVQDRFMFSDPAYAKARGNGVGLTGDMFIDIKKELNKVGALTVLVTTSWENIVSRWNSKEMYDLEDIRTAYEWYLNNLFIFDKVVEDASNDDILDIVKVYSSIQVV